MLQYNTLKQSGGIYNSFWISKFSNFFIKKGKKKRAIKHVNLTLMQIKLVQNIYPLIYVFEIIDSIKPTFKLENVFPGKTAIVYPRVVNVNRRYNVALKWIKLYILENRYNAGRDTLGFWNHLYMGIERLAKHRSNPLIRKRDEYHQHAVILQENIRYTWVK